MKRYQKIFAALFFVYLYGAFFTNLWLMGDQTLSDVKALQVPEKPEDLQGYTAAVDGILVDDLAGGHLWNEVYGTVYAALGKMEENDFSYSKDKNGFLQNTNFWNNSDITAMELAQRMKRMQEATAGDGTKVIFLMYPSKYDETRTEGCYGMPYRNMNDFGDEFLRYLRRYNVDYIDFRDMCETQGIEQADLYYFTDHHWRAETGFRIMSGIVEHLDSVYNAGLDPDGFYRDISHYTSETYGEIYMGSMGRETGYIYGGMDDYTYLYPVFDTDFYRTHINSDMEVGVEEGGILSCLISRKFLDYDDVYTREMYNSYLGGAYLAEQIDNRMNPDGVRMMFIRDSYSSPVGVFLAPMCSRLTMFWAVECKPEAIEEQIEKEQPDYIFVACTVDQIVDAALPFYVESDDRMRKRQNQ